MQTRANDWRGAALSVALLALAMPLAPATASADESPAPTVGIEEIVVVANKDNRSIRQVAATVTTLSREDLESQLAGSLDDVFRYVPGVDTEAAGTRFRSEAINVRGIGGNRVAVLVDGVPLADQFSIGSFSNATRQFLDTGLIRDVEVLHGPASALYGSSAIAGVVAARTADPGDPGNVAVSWRGADRSLRTQATLTGGGDALGFVVGASVADGEQLRSAAIDGALDRRDTKHRAGIATLVFDDTRGGEWRASMLHQDSTVISDLDSLVGTGRFRSTTALRGDDDCRTDLVNLSYAFLGPGGLVDDGVIRTFAQRTDVAQATVDERVNASTPVLIERLFAYQQDLHGVDINLWRNLRGASVTHRIGFGVEYRNRITDERRDGLQTTLADGQQTSTILGEEFPLRDFPVSRTTELGAYLEDTIQAGPWTVIAAVRGDRFALQPRPDDIYLADNPSADPVALRESDLSPKLGVIREVSPGLDVYVQYAHGFRAPPYSDANIGLDIPLFNIRAIPNPDLRSESSDGYEVGLRLFQPGLVGHASVFYTRYEDFIETKVRLGTDPVSGRILFQSQNLHAATIRGAEASLSWYFGKRRAFSVDASAFYAIGRNEETGQPLNSVGPPQAVVGLSWSSADARRQLQLKSVLTRRWDERDASGGDLFEAPGHAVADLFFAQRIGRQITLRAGLHNLTDRTYWYWGDVSGLAADDPLLAHLARPGRSLSLSIHFNW